MTINLSKKKIIISIITVILFIGVLASIVLHVNKRLLDKNLDKYAAGSSTCTINFLIPNIFDGKLKGNRMVGSYTGDCTKPLPLSKYNEVTRNVNTNYVNGDWYGQYMSAIYKQYSLSYRETVLGWYYSSDLNRRYLPYEPISKISNGNLYVGLSYDISDSSLPYNVTGSYFRIWNDSNQKLFSVNVDVNESLSEKDIKYLIGHYKEIESSHVSASSEGDAYIDSNKNFPVKSGYYFLNFTNMSKSENVFSSGDAVKMSGREIYMNFVRESVTVTFNPGGGTVGTQSKVVKIGQTYGDLPTPTHATKLFRYWLNERGTIITKDSTVYETKDHSLHAEYCDAVTVTFYTKDSNLIDHKTICKGSSVERPNDYNLDGYEFVGWITSKTDPSTVFNFDQPVNSNTVVYAHLIKVETYNIDYDANGGDIDSVPISQTKTKGKGLKLSIIVPTRDGYEFVGWNTKADGSGVDYSPGVSYLVNESNTLYAQWRRTTTGNSYEITYNANGGKNAPSPGTKNQGVSYTISNSKPTRDNYLFDNWNTKEDGSGTTYSSGSSYTVDAAVTLYAQWTGKKIVLSFNTNGGSNISNKTVNHGDTYGALPKPTKTGYILAGWYTDPEFTIESKVYADKEIDLVENATLYARWISASQNTYVGDIKSDGEINTIDYAMLKRFVFGSYILDEKEISVADINNDNVIDEDDAELIKKAILGTYELNICEATFVTNGGSDIDNIKTNCKTKISKPTNPTKNNSSFVDWYIDSDFETLYDFNTIMDEDITLYAKWDDTFTISFNARGGSVSPASKTVTYGSTYGNLPTPTWSGHTFEGWYFDNSFTDALTSDKVVNINDDIEVYAKWDSDNIDISKISNYTVLDDDKVIIKEKTKPTEIVVNDGYQTMHIAPGKFSVEYVGTGDYLKVYNQDDPDNYKMYTIIVLGDANGDGEVNSGDLYFIQLHLLDKRILTSSYYVGANANIDDDVNSGDLYVIQRYLVGKGTLPPKIHTQ